MMFSSPSLLWWCCCILTFIINLSSIVHAKDEAGVAVACPPHGCPFLPRDISFDKTSRTALKRLRRGGATTNTAIDERKQLLQDLSTAGNDETTVWTLIGYKGGAMKDQINQDRALILSPFQIGVDDNNKNDVATTAQLLGVFDGHGKLGEIVAEYAVTELPLRLAKELQAIVQTHDSNERDDQVTATLIKIFNDIDRSVPTKGIGGCTASVVLRLESKMYVANAGDSVSFVASYNESTDQVDVLYVTREDKPHLPDEHQRIISMGGRVSQSEGKGDSSRVVFVDPNTGYVSGLAMSRSIGDWAATGVISEPMVQVLSIPELLAKASVNQTATTSTATCNQDDPETCPEVANKDEKVHIFAVSATDGLMDYFEPKEIARAFADSFYKHSNETPHPHTVAEDLILKASEGWFDDMGGRYRDDITVAAARIYSSSPDASINKVQELSSTTTSVV